MTRAKAKAVSTTYLCELDDGTDNVQRYVTLEGDAEPAKGDRVVFGDVVPGEEGEDGNSGPEGHELDTLIVAEDVTEEHADLPVVRTVAYVQTNHADDTADDDAAVGE